MTASPGDTTGEIDKAGEDVLLLDEGVFTFHVAMTSTRRACTSCTVSECCEKVKKRRNIIKITYF